MALINWETVVSPRKWGGLGIPNLQIRNCSLLLRWWWRAYKEPQSLWGATVKRINRLHTIHAPMIWKVSGSFFWICLLKIKALFHWCTSWKVGDGRSISFWYDSWATLPLRHYRDNLPRPTKQQLSLSEALVSPSQRPHTKEMAEIVTTPSQDHLEWKWTRHGEYTASSVYKLMVSGGRTRWGYDEIWRGKAPSKVKFFVYLLLQEKILTRDVLERRGIPCQQQCVMCNSGSRETALHLMYECSYASTVWITIANKWGLPVVQLIQQGPASVTIEELWRLAWQVFRGRSNIPQVTWVVRLMAVLWNIWLQRNEQIFKGKVLPESALANKAWGDSDLWLKCCCSKEYG